MLFWVRVWVRGQKNCIQLNICIYDYVVYDDDNEEKEDGSEGTSSEQTGSEGKMEKYFLETIKSY